MEEEENEAIEEEASKDETEIQVDRNKLSLLNCSSLVSYC